MLLEVTDLIYKQIDSMRYHRSIRLVTNYKLPLIKLVLTRNLNGQEV